MPRGARLGFRANPDIPVTARPVIECANDVGGKRVIGESGMATRLALAMVAAALLAGCSTMHCQEQSRNQRAAGECGLFSKF